MNGDARFLAVNGNVKIKKYMKKGLHDKNCAPSFEDSKTWV